MTSPQLIMLCGIPTCGKSTWAVNYLQEVGFEDWVILSTDSFIDNRARENNITYDEAFGEYIKAAQDRMMFDLRAACRGRKNILWDQTNLTPQVRKKKLNQVPVSYTKTAVWFNLPLAEALERNKHREGKFIPEEVLMSMAHSFTPPDVSEGFDNVALAWD